MRAVLSAAIALSLGACQAYRLDPVAPKALASKTQPVAISGIQKPAKIMLAIDRSGSMKYRTSSDSSWGCCASVDGENCVGYDASGDCKWNVLKGLLVEPGQFLDSTRAQARHGLAIFPDTSTSSISAPACTEGRVLVEVGGAPGETVDTIKASLDSSELAPSGGTPTAALLNSIFSDSIFMREEAGASRYVILITDGLPNCNSELDGRTCVCTSGDCESTPQSCLDDVRMVDAVKALKARGVDSFVIGFGSALDNPAAKQVLDQAAEAGGQEQQNKPTKFYQAGSKEDLQAILDQINQTRLVPQPCAFALDAPLQDGALVEVSVDDSQTPDEKVELKRGKDWTLACSDSGANPSAVCPADGTCAAGTSCWRDSGKCQGRCTDLGRIEIEGDWCTTLQNAQPGRYTLEFVSTISIK